jgi:hypothetical protein
MVLAYLAAGAYNFAGIDRIDRYLAAAHAGIRPAWNCQGQGVPSQGGNPPFGRFFALDSRKICLCEFCDLLAKCRFFG